MLFYLALAFDRSLDGIAGYKSITFFSCTENDRELVFSGASKPEWPLLHAIRFEPYFADPVVQPPEKGLSPFGERQPRERDKSG
jgi:hypothetical protein